MIDVGVGEQHELRIYGSTGSGVDPLLQSPGLADPTWWARGSGHHPEGEPGADPGHAPCHLGGPVGAAVVDQYHLGRAAVVLVQQTGESVGDKRCFVASGYHDRDRRPAARWRTGRQANVGAPEVAAAEKQEDPDRRRDPNHQAPPRHTRHAPNVVAGVHGSPVVHRTGVRYGGEGGSFGGLLADRGGQRPARRDG